MSRASQLGPSTQQSPFGSPLASEAPPSKRDLTSWWKQFKKNSRPKEEERVVSPTPSPIFGAPLEDSIKYANVAISLFDENGNSYIYGYVPIIVAKCGVFLKEKATDVEGIFRVAGAERRIRELQNAFNSPERFGKGLDWGGYTVHDAANILRRYLNQLPEPIIPLNSYELFREPIRNHQAQAVGEMESQEPAQGGFDPDAAIKTYQQHITELPPLNRQLLLYILDLLAVFASKSDVNLMTAANLAAIFQPGVLSHPTHDMAPKEYRLSQDVLIFLIENQDNFIVGMQGTEMPKETIKEVQSGVPSPQIGSSSPNPTNGNKTNVALGRSASTASAGAESNRPLVGIRRNVSVNSKRSRQSANSPSPVTPPPDSPYATSGKAIGVHRSNTVPSKKSASPAIGSGRFQSPKGSAPSSPAPAPATPVAPVAPIAITQPAQTTTTSKLIEENLNVTDSHRNVSTSTTDSVYQPAPERQSPHLRPVPDRNGKSSEKIANDLPSPSGRLSPAVTPSRERTFSNYFTKLSPTTEPKDGRQPNKLRKKRLDQPGVSAQSSTHSLTGASHPSSPSMHATTGSAVGPTTALEGQESNVGAPDIPQYDGTHDTVDGPPAVNENQAVIEDSTESAIKDDVAGEEYSTALRDQPQRLSGTTTLKPNTSPPPSFSQPGFSQENIQTPDEDTNEKRSRWRFSSHNKKSSKGDALGGDLANSHLGSASAADRSTSTVGSVGPDSRPRKSFTDDSQKTSSSNNNDPEPNSDRNLSFSSDRKESRSSGPIGWFRGKLQERKEREAEKERAKSPSPPPVGRELMEPPPNMASIVGDKKSSVSSEANTSTQQPPVTVATTPAAGIPSGEGGERQA